MATINSLTSLTTPASNDLLAIWDSNAGSGEEPTKKTTLSHLLNSITTVSYNNAISYNTTGKSSDVTTSWVHGWKDKNWICVQFSVTWGNNTAASANENVDYLIGTITDSAYIPDSNFGAASDVSFSGIGILGCSIHTDGKMYVRVLANTWKKGYSVIPKIRFPAHS